jgi:hypothetical protein
MKRRPCWAVLAPKQKNLEAVAGIHDRSRDDEEPHLHVERGTKKHDTILEFDPGGGSLDAEAIAQAVSQTVMVPAYVLELDEDYPRVQVFEKGQYAGEINAWPDSVAKQLGCTFPMMLGGGVIVDLTPRREPNAKERGLKLCGSTIGQWQHMIEHTSNWGVLLDGTGAAHGRALLAATGDARADVRAVACTLLGAIGYVGKSEFGLGEVANAALQRVRELALVDPDAKVRAAANETGESLAESIEKHVVYEEFPWLANFSTTALAPAVAALDDERAAVRAHVVLWWRIASEFPKAIGTRVEEKLTRMLSGAKDTREQKSIELALAHVRRQMAGPG